MSWNNGKIKVKIPVMIVGFAIVLGLRMAAAGYLTASSEISKLTEQKLAALAQDRKVQLKSWLHSIERDLKIVAANPITAQAITDFQRIWATVKGDKTETLKKTHIKDKPNPLGEKHLLEQGPPRHRP